MTASIDTEEPDRRHSRGEGAEDFPEAVVDRVAQAIDKPSARGWIHVYSAVVAFICGATLVSVSWAMVGTRAGLATLIYTLTIVAMFAVSGAYHRVNWKSDTVRKWMKRADHSMIFVFIAGSYTPFALLALPSEKGWVLFWIVWSGALAGVLLKMFWPSAPRWVGVPLYLLLGWVAVWFVGPILRRRGRRGPGPADRRWRALQHRRRAVRPEVAQSVARDVRTPRVLPRLHGGGGDLPLHRDVVRRLLVAISACAVAPRATSHAEITQSGLMFSGVQ